MTNKPTKSHHRTYRLHLAEYYKQVKKYGMVDSCECTACRIVSKWNFRNS